MTAPIVPLPPLREDLQIMRGGISYSGEPIWVVLDPVRNRFFRVSYEMFQILSLWNRSRTLANLTETLQSRFGRTVEDEEIGTVIRMFDTSLWLEQPAAGSWRSLYDLSQRRHSWFMRLVHNYLFFKVPLLRPERFIRASWPFVAFFFTRGFLFVALVAGLGGLYLVSRQWDAFVATFSYAFTLEGAAISLISIAFIKSLHELGHAYVAHRHGCRIPTMGIAFMVMVPLLYTDVSDAWKLKSRRERLMIDSAGVVTELCVAAFALLLWAFLPDGPLRSAVFVLATAGWIMSLIVNINPFMRFDGYYVMADLLNIENLQPRAFRHMRWRLREVLFATGEPSPEPFPPRLDAIVTVYAILTAIYRIVLYLGIALLVYHFTIKLIGVLLFVVEIGFFIIRPVWAEFKEWWSMRQDIFKSRRTYFTLAVLGALLGLAAFPIFTQVSAPAVAFPSTFARLYPQEAGQLEAIYVQRGDHVKKGDALFVLSAPDLIQERKITEIEIELAQRRLSRIGADAEDLGERGVIQSELGSLTAKREGLKQREDSLVIHAPFDSHVSDMNSSLSIGQWISQKEQLAFLSGDDGTVMRGYIKGEDRWRIEENTHGWFIPDDLSLPKIPVQLSEIALSGAQQIELPQLTSHYNGRIAVHSPEAGRENRVVPVSAQYAVIARVSSELASPSQTWRGVIVFDGKGQSMMTRLWRQVVRVLIREAGP